MSKAKRRIWTPDETDIRIVQTLVDLSGPNGALVVVGELAEEIKVPIADLAPRLRWMCQVGYLRKGRSTQGYTRYVVVKVPQPGDEHDLGLYSAKSKGNSLGAEQAVEAAVLYEQGTTVRVLMEKYSASYAVVRQALLDAGVELRGPR
jgi:hypothetical protein